MDHGAVINSGRHTARLMAGVAMVLLTLAIPAAATAADAAAPAPAPAVAVAPVLIEPADGHHFDHLERAPMVQFDPGKDASGKLPGAQDRVFLSVNTPLWVS